MDPELADQAHPRERHAACDMSRITPGPAALVPAGSRHEQHDWHPIEAVSLIVAGVVLLATGIILNSAWPLFG